jgi:hypothetical protein
MVFKLELILGHNQFIGINHVSNDKAREREKKFSKIENVYHVVEMASELGFKSMIIETHPRMLDFLDLYQKNQTFDMDFYLQVPYAVGYIKKMNENGIMGLMSDVISETGISGGSSMALKGLTSFFKRDFFTIAMSILKMEIAPFSEVNIKALLLHNVFTDLLLSLGTADTFREFEAYVRNELSMKPGFNTLNLALLNKRFKEWNVNPSFVMTPVNYGGFSMNPSQEMVEECIKDYNDNLIAMNILGGGAFSVEKAYEYLKSLSINKCVIGASSGEHLSNLADIFK